MKRYFFRLIQTICILLIINLNGCKKAEDATPQLTCRTEGYTSLDGTSNANKYTYAFTYGAEDRPVMIEYVYGNFNPSTAQKGSWLYNYKTAGKVIIEQTLENKHYTTLTLTLDDKGRVTHREDGDVMGAKVMYDYEYDSKGYLARIKKAGGDETLITSENGYLRSAKIGSSTITITTDEQLDFKQPIPIGFLGIQWPLVSFLGKPFRGNIAGYKSGYAYQVNTNSLNVQGGLISREITYTDPATSKSVPYLKETYVTTCK